MGIGLGERFDQTLRRMLWGVVAEHGYNWDLMIPCVLFGVREVPQASTAFIPFKLLFGRQPRSLLDVTRKAWEQQQQSRHQTTIEHVRDIQERIERITQIIKEHLAAPVPVAPKHVSSSLVIKS